MRRDSWRSVPTMCRPPALITASCRTCHSARSLSICVSLLGRLQRLVLADLEDRAARCAPPSTMSVPRPAMLVAMVIDFGSPGLRDDLRLARVLLRVQHLVRQLLLLRGTLRQQLGVLDRRRADEHRLAALVAVA